MNKTLRILIMVSFCLALCASFFACKNGGEKAGGNPVPSVDESTDANDGVLTEAGSPSEKDKDSIVQIISIILVILFMLPLAQTTQPGMVGYTNFLGFEV